jgi:UDP-glucose 4-epimerase
MKVLVTGAAGFIGSTVAAALHDAGDVPVVLDDLSKGSPSFLNGYPAYIGDCADPAVLARIFDDHPDIDVAIHCAACTIVPESIIRPLTYYSQNVAKTISLVEQLLAHGCTRLIFSSSAAVYGAAPAPVVTEDSPTNPGNAYGASKLMVERILADTCAATPLSALSLRYFNPVGCDPQLRSGPYEPAPTHALGSLLAAWNGGDPFWIHGSDWDTVDGTPVRDFVHVWDVARAHVAAAHYGRGGSGHAVVNIGSGRPTTVLQLAETFNRFVDNPVDIRFDGRRPGDASGCVTSTDRARELLGWRPQRTIADAVADALGWAARERVLELADPAQRADARP